MIEFISMWLNHPSHPGHTLELISVLFPTLALLWTKVRRMRRARGS